MPSPASKSWKAFFGSKWFIAGGTIVLLVVIFAFGRAYYQNYLIHQEIARLQKEVERLRGKRLETFDLLRYVKSPAYVEEKARTELNLRREGEQMAIVRAPVTSTGDHSRQAAAPVIESPRDSNLRRWWKYFFE